MGGFSYSNIPVGAQIDENISLRRGFDSFGDAARGMQDRGFKRKDRAFSMLNDIGKINAQKTRANILRNTDKFKEGSDAIGSDVNQKYLDATSRFEDNRNQLDEAEQILTSSGKYYTGYNPDGTKQLSPQAMALNKQKKDSQYGFDKTIEQLNQKTRALHTTQDPEGYSNRIYENALESGMLEPQAEDMRVNAFKQASPPAMTDRSKELFKAQTENNKMLAQEQLKAIKSQFYEGNSTSSKTGGSYSSTTSSRKMLSDGIGNNVQKAKEAIDEALSRSNAFGMSGGLDSDGAWEEITKLKELNPNMTYGQLTSAYLASAESKLPFGLMKNADSKTAQDLLASNPSYSGSGKGNSVSQYFNGIKDKKGYNAAVKNALLGSQKRTRDTIRAFSPDTIASRKRDLLGVKDNQELISKFDSIAEPVVSSDKVIDKYKRPKVVSKKKTPPEVAGTTSAKAKSTPKIVDTKNTVDNIKKTDKKTRTTNHTFDGVGGLIDSIIDDFSKDSPAVSKDIDNIANSTLGFLNKTVNTKDVADKIGNIWNSSMDNILPPNLSNNRGHELSKKDRRILNNKIQDRKILEKKMAYNSSRVDNENAVINSAIDANDRPFSIKNPQDRATKQLEKLTIPMLKKIANELRSRTGSEVSIALNRVNDILRQRLLK